MFKSRGPHRQRSMSRWQKLSVVSLAHKQRPHLSVDTSMLRELAQGGAEFLKQWYANQTGKDPWWASDSHTFDGGACAVLEQEALSPRLSKPGGSTGGPDVKEEFLRLQKAFKQNASRRMRSFDKFAHLLGTCDTRDHSVFTFGAGVAGKETGLSLDLAHSSCTNLTSVPCRGCPVASSRTRRAVAATSRATAS